MGAERNRRPVAGNEAPPASRQCAGPGCVETVTSAATGGRRRLYCSTRCQKAAYRERHRPAAPAVDPVPVPADPVGALAEWCRDVLRVPAGHPAAGEPMALPDYGERFVRDALAHHESLLCIARKNAKSAIVAALLLGYLAGPLRAPGFRGGVVSLNREKAGELKRQVQAIAAASSLDGVTFRRAGQPQMESAYGSVDILPADKDAGQASGFDIAIIDEVGLLAEKHRSLVNSMRSSVSAKGGRVVHLSIHGSGPFVPEMLLRGREGDPDLAIHHYAAQEDCRLDDEAAWAAANPGLGTVKDREYMRAAAARAAATPADAPAFRAHELNLPGNPDADPIVTVDDWRGACVAEAPERDGSCVIGIDLGGSQSMTAAVVIWPGTGRMEARGAFPGEPDLETRGERDGVGALYERMREAGELETYGGRVTPVREFLADLADALQGETVLAAGADRFRRAETIDVLDAAGLPWPMVWRGQGASATADGSADVRAFQRAVAGREIRPVDGLLMRSAIRESALRYDGAGNPALAKDRTRGRIDALAAAVIAAGLAEQVRAGRIARPGVWFA